MELLDLQSGLESIASSGHILNCQEIIGVQSGLTVLRSQETCEKIYFWGKIFGQTSDYYIAYALGDSDFEFPSKVFYFAGENFEFKALARLTEEMAERIISLGIEKPFTGDAGKLIEEQPADGEEPPPAEDEGAEAQEAVEKPEKLTEAHRLAQIVQEIDFDTAVVPKGAYALNESHMVVPSNDFKGLGLTEATSLSKYMHYRPPTSVAALRALARNDVQFYANFLDPVDGDLPKGCWALRQDPSLALVTLRSLSWPGYVAFHVPATTRFGGLYFGYAQRNRDLPFMV